MKLSLNLFILFVYRHTHHQYHILLYYPLIEINKDWFLLSLRIFQSPLCGDNVMQSDSESNIFQ